MVLGVVIVAFGTTFQLQMQELAHNRTHPVEYGNRGFSGLQSSMWATFLFTILGDFDGATFYNGGPGMIVCFVLVTFLTNIIMLNVLIAIVSQAQEDLLSEGDTPVSR